MPTAKKQSLIDKVVTFPPMNAEEEAKFMRFLSTTGEFMGVELNTELQTVVAVTIPSDRADVITVMNKLALAQKKRK